MHYRQVGHEFDSRENRTIKGLNTLTEPVKTFREFLILFNLTLPPGHSVCVYQWQWVGKGCISNFFFQTPEFFQDSEFKSLWGAIFVNHPLQPPLNLVLGTLLMFYLSRNFLIFEKWKKLPRGYRGQIFQTFFLFKTDPVRSTSIWTFHRGQVMTEHRNEEIITENTEMQSIS